MTLRSRHFSAKRKLQWKRCFQVVRCTFATQFHKDTREHQTSPQQVQQVFFCFSFFGARSGCPESETATSQANPDVFVLFFFVCGGNRTDKGRHWLCIELPCPPHLAFSSHLPTSHETATFEQLQSRGWHQKHVFAAAANDIANTMNNPETN